MLESIYASGRRSGSPLASFLASRLQEAPIDQQWKPEDPIGGTNFAPAAPTGGSPYMMQADSSPPAPASPPVASAPQAGAQPAATAPATATGTTASSSTSYDYSSDPVLLKIKAAANADIAEAEQEALLGRRNALVALGSPDVAKKYLSSDDPTIPAISSDPDKSTSALARIARAFRQLGHDTDEGLNQQNLFYSGYRGDRLKNMAQDRLTEEADATSAAEKALSDIARALIEAKRNARNAVVAGEGSAYGRAVTNPGSGAGGGGTGGGTGGGGGGDTGGGGGGGGAETPNEGAIRWAGDHWEVYANGKWQATNMGQPAEPTEGELLDAAKPRRR